MVGMTDQELLGDTDLGDVQLSSMGAAALITISRPERLNAFTSETIDHLITAFRQARAAKGVAAVVLTGSGTRAFCAGGDQKQRASLGNYGPGASGTLATEELYRVIRECPKPVIAAVNGYALGGGHVMHLVCDLSVASQTAVFAQSGPQVGSFDAGYGSAYLARVIGEKRARQMLLLCERIDSATALAWGLVNAVVEPEQVLPTALAWANRCGALSPTGLALLKHSLNADTEHVAGLGRLCFDALSIFAGTAEAREGCTAFVEKRPANFGGFRAGDDGERSSEL